MTLFARSTVLKEAEFHRIAALPRRTWSDDQIAAMVSHYTEAYRRPDGTQTLLPLQAQALHELRLWGGIYGPIPVGEGKTLITLLAPAVVNARRPVLLTRAALLEKTRHEKEVLSRHWRLPDSMQYQSFEMLSREGSANWLEITAPDLAVVDEAHRLKNLKAGVTRRFRRYMLAKPQTRCVFLSGTLYKDDLRDCAHLAEWALKEGSPMPLRDGALIEWSEALAVQKNPMKEWHPGCLLDFATEEDESDDVLVTARKGFQRRLRETPGVVMPRAHVSSTVTCSLSINAIVHPVAPITEANFTKLRTEWSTPDEWMFTSAAEGWRHARELALGMHYVWDPRPPKEWLAARKKWASYVRNAIQAGESFDTELQVKNACAADPHLEFDHPYRAWVEIEPTFQVRPKMVWHDDAALDAVVKWTRGGPGVVWTEHAFFAREVARRTGLVYYGEEGKNDQGQSIESADPRTCVIASVKANSTGRNIQFWSRGLITVPPSDALGLEQLIGRLHRPGQRADEVTFDALVGCYETAIALHRAIERAQNTRDVTGAPQKLLLADVDWPSEDEIDAWGMVSKRWVSQS